MSVLPLSLWAIVPHFPDLRSRHPLLLSWSGGMPRVPRPAKQSQDWGKGLWCPSHSHFHPGSCSGIWADDSCSAPFPPTLPSPPLITNKHPVYTGE